jgi:hypothetical protein
MDVFITRARRTNYGVTVGNITLAALALYLFLAVAVHGSGGDKMVSAQKQIKVDGDSVTTVVCPPGEVRTTTLIDISGRYLYSEKYGWFDNQHFRSGNPEQVIEDVRAAAKHGGGVVSLRQSVREGLTGYTGHYLIAGNLNEGEVLGVALGIYMDWSYRFEAWQGQLPRSLVGPLTAFAIEDLPTHYVGFFAAASGLDVAEVFACYLGEVEVTDTTPPHFLVADASEPGALDVPVKRLTNEKFSPMVETDEGWQNVPWPPGLRLAPIDSATGLWAFEQEETWYFNGG